MLVLSRKQNESIIIDGNIEVVVLGMEGETVKLGIRAPKEIEIYRKELYDSIIKSNQEAAKVTISLEQIAKFIQSGRDEKK